jgi:hypothetical protein
MDLRNDFYDLLIEYLIVEVEIVFHAEKLCEVNLFVGEFGKQKSVLFTISDKANLVLGDNIC